MIDVDGLEPTPTLLVWKDGRMEHPYNGPSTTAQYRNPNTTTGNKRLNIYQPPSESKVESIPTLTSTYATNFDLVRSLGGADAGAGGGGGGGNGVLGGQGSRSKLGD